MLNAVAGLVIAVMLVLWSHWVPLLLVAGFGATTLGAFIVSTTVGLFGINERWVGGYVWAAAVSEAVAILTGIVCGWREGYLTRSRSRHGRGRVTGRQ